MSIEAMKQALERAMEVLELGDAADPITVGETIDALRAAIDQAEKQEVWALREVLFADGEAIAHREPEKQEPAAIVVDAYDTPGLQWLCQHPPKRGDRLYTAPQPTARREWQGLTDEEIEDEWERITGHSIFGGDKAEGRAMYLAPDEVTEFTRAVEAKLKEKNTCK